MSIFWEVIVSVILSITCMYSCPTGKKFSEIELFQCAVEKLLLKCY